MSASERGTGPAGEPFPSSGTFRAARETAQPSLWDRLVNDLPGLASEIDGVRQGLIGVIGRERLDSLVSGGMRAVEADPDVTPDQKRAVNRLIVQERRRADLERRGVVVSAEVLREAVRRDIEALFNCERFEATTMLSDAEAEQRDDDPPALDGFPEVRRSVINYGVPPFSGRSARDFDRDVLAREIRSILAAFEPRLRASATKVTVSLGDKIAGLSIEIDALLIMAPSPERLRLRTMIDLDNGLARTELKEA
jgi:type VI secretion system protein ImpF